MRKIALSWALAGLGLCALPAWTQQQAPPASGQGVGRVSVLQGDVSTQRGDSGEWQSEALNAPLVSGDKIATGAGARTELQLDFADVLRLDGNAQATLATLTDAQLQVQLGQGVAEFNVLRGATATVEIDTPNLAVHPKGPGIYRIEVDNEGQTLVTAVQGDATISVPAGSTDLHAGQLITVQGTDNPQYQVADAAPPDGFDRWNQTRDTTITSALSRQNANGYYTGVSDLDGYGRWTFVPGYGQVWVPAGTAAGWTPYSAGRWVWEPYYGWTWVSTEAWGWAPYHYGRWFLYDANWVWWPGPVTPMYRPIWAPAYVSFIGFQAGPVAIGVGVGRIGWMPIGPADPYRPWFGGGVGVVAVAPLAVGPRYTVVYSNVARMQSDPRVVVMVSGDNFGHGAVVRQTVTVEQLRTVTVVRGEVPVVPTRESLQVSERPVNVAALPHAAVAPPARFYGSKPTPPPASFEQQRVQVQQRLAAPAATRPAGTTTAPAAAAGRSAPAPTAASGPGSPGWHSFGAPAGAPAAAGRAPAAAPSATAPAATRSGETPAATAAERGATAAPATAANGYKPFTPPPPAKKPAEKKPAPPPKVEEKPAGGGGGVR